MLGKLRASVQLLIESGLLSGSRILVQNTLCSSLVDSLNSDLDSLSLVSSIGLDSNVSLLDLCLELRVDHLVLQGLCGSDLNALLSGFDVGHSRHLLDRRIIVRRNRLNRIGGHRFALNSNNADIIIPHSPRKCKSFFAFFRKTADKKRGLPLEGP